MRSHLQHATCIAILHLAPDRLVGNLRRRGISAEQKAEQNHAANEDTCHEKPEGE